MQPTLVLSAPQPGILYINGRFAGEISNDFPLIRPVGGRGAVYLDYRPLHPGSRSMARKLVFSGGAPMAESVEEAANLSVVAWPGGTVEIELTPPREEMPTQRCSLAGHELSLRENALYCDGQLLCTLPEGASLPEILPAGGNLLSGSCSAGRYLLMLSGDWSRLMGLLQAQQLDAEASGHIRALVSRNDLVGHAALESWRATPEGLALLSSESVWEHGSPRWPRTPPETARAAVEALLAGLNSEAEGYLAPALRNQFQPGEILARCDLCVEMKYAAPDPRPCVGLLQLQGGQFARVQPLYYRASPSGGAQGPWQLDALELE